MYEILNYLNLDHYSETRSLILPSFMASSLSLGDIEKIKSSTQVTSISINPDKNIFTVDYLNENGICLGRQKIM